MIGEGVRSAGSGSETASTTHSPSIDGERVADAAVGSKRKRPDRSAHLLRRSTIDISVIKMKLNSVCRSPILTQEIERCVQGVTRAAIEASRLINMHMLHLLSTNTPVPELDQTYFYAAFTLVAGSSYPDAVQKFGDAYVEYQRLRPRDMQRFDRKNVNQILNESAKEFMVACKNHVVLNIAARVSKAFKRSLLSLRQQFKAPDRNKIIRYYMRRMTREGSLKDEERMWRSLTFPPSDATKAHVRTYTTHHLEEYADLPLDVGGLEPIKRVEKQWWLYLPWLYKIQQEIDATPEEDRSARSFSMLPLCSLQARYIMISSTTLHGMLKRLPDEEIPAQGVFLKQKRQHWEKYFNLSKAEGNSKRLEFEYSLRTDGYAASIVVSKKKPEKMVTDAQPPISLDNKTDAQPRISLDNKRVVAVDPGRIDLVTCVSKNQHEEQSVTHYSNSDYREKIGSARAPTKRRTWLKKDNDLQDRLTALPTAKTASIQQLTVHMVELFRILDDVLQHNFKSKVRGLKFTQFGRKQKVMHDICKRICTSPDVDDKRNVVVAFGNGMFSSTSKGHCPGPVKGVIAALRRRKVEVYVVNEDYTSQLCSQCHEMLEPMYREKKCKAIYSVRRCVTANCPRTLWNRDTNAARNILFLLHIFLHETLHGSRLEVFCRRYQSRLRSAQANQSGRKLYQVRPTLIWSRLQRSSTIS